MPRALWSGAISFGLVFIPVSLTGAEAPDELELSLLDRRDFAPVGYKRVNKATGEEVPWDDIVKGYEHKPDEYVALTPADFEQANVKATQTIDLISFVDLADVDPVYFEKPYYLRPGKHGEKVYALLREALARSGKAAVAQIVIRVKQHLALVLAMDDVLVLNTLRYPQEIKPVADLDLPPATVKPGLSKKEVDAAVALIESMSEDWQPQNYRDRYRDDLMKLIRRKIKSRKVHALTEPQAPAPEDETENAQVIDLVALLKKSLTPSPAKSTTPRKSRNPKAA